MTHWQLGEKEKAKQLLQEAEDWFEERDTVYPWIQLFRAEAAELINSAN